MTSFVPASVATKVSSWMQIIKALPFNGGPSVTRWVFQRTAEVVSFGWLCLVGGAVYQFARFAHADAIYCTLIATLGAGLFGFSQNAQTTKLAIDSKGTGSPSTVESSPLSSKVTSGEQTQ